MKKDELYTELGHLAERLGIVVSEKSFRNVGVAVQSGFCVVKGKERIIVDRSLSAAEKAKILAECLAEAFGDQVDQMYVVPAVREFIQRHKGKKFT